jgi:hypothetical protein
MAMSEPQYRNDDEYRHEVTSRDRMRSDAIGLVEISSQCSLLDDRPHLVEDVELVAPGARFSRNPEIQIDIDDRISGSVSPKNDTRHFLTVVIAAALVTLAGLGWIAGSTLNFFEASTAPVPGIQVAPLSSISNPAKPDRAEIKNAPSNLIATATPAATESIGNLLKMESVRSVNSVRPPKTKQNTTSRVTIITERSEIPRTPVPETKPTTIEGWSVRDANHSTAVLEGPTGVWKATRGDTVPGVGRIDSIVRWGNRWIVATSRGLISTP